MCHLEYRLALGETSKHNDSSQDIVEASFPVNHNARGRKMIPGQHCSIRSSRYLFSFLFVTSPTNFHPHSWVVIFILIAQTVSPVPHPYFSSPEGRKRKWKQSFSFYVRYLEDRHIISLRSYQSEFSHMATSRCNNTYKMWSVAGRPGTQLNLRAFKY